MKRLISTNLSFDSDWLSLALRGSHYWTEFGFGLSLSCNWYPNTFIREQYRCKTSNILTIHFLWWYFQVSVWI